jgi:hypothetical protein
MMTDKKDDKDNIIIFPKVKQEPKKQISAKHQKELKDLQARLFVTTLMEKVQDELFILFGQNSIQTDDAQFQKDFAFIMESVKSCLYRDFSLKHNLHNIVDRVAQSVAANGKILKEGEEDKLSYVQMDYSDILFRSKIRKKDLPPETLKKLEELISKHQKKDDDGDKIT